MNYNRLKDEKSTYLLQHQNNPVHWWAYGPEAIQKAKDENKPIFLSIGYSSCHWCHVMAHESFADQATADFLNENFINIKIDKEEYPDIDQYFQQSCQMFGRNGGWPLSVFLLPDMKPYFIGTYFPKVSKYNMPSFRQILEEMARIYKDEKSLIEENASKVVKSLTESRATGDDIKFAGHFPPPTVIMNAIADYQDNTNGGFGAAPKFPTFAFWEWAVEQMLEGMIDEESQRFVINSIEHILTGGIYDHLRGGIHRYSVDAAWLVPHFEKMLYDQAGFLRLLAKFSLIHPSPLVSDAIIQTLNYLKSEMVSNEGYFFSAQDADSEGVEGLYFVFSEEQFEDAINNANNSKLAKNIDKLKTWFGVSKKGNFENGLNVLSLNHPQLKDIVSAEGWELVRMAKDALYEQRKMRTPPDTDNKGVASWNFMMISALFDVAQFSQMEAIKSLSSEILDLTLQKVHDAFVIVQKGKDYFNIRHTSTKEASLPYVEDYVFYAQVQLQMYERAGNENIKTNFIRVLNFIFDEFFEDGKLYTRAIKANENVLYHNIEVSPFDSSFRSPYATLIYITRKAVLLSDETDWYEKLNPLMESMAQLTLKNPLSAGEGLRALTYPSEGYRIVKIPRSWTENTEFNNVKALLLPRFTFQYHDAEDENWQICSATECQLQGHGLQEFIERIPDLYPKIN